MKIAPTPELLNALTELSEAAALALLTDMARERRVIWLQAALTSDFLSRESSFARFALLAKTVHPRVLERPLDFAHERALTELIERWVERYLKWAPAEPWAHGRAGGLTELQRTTGALLATALAWDVPGAVSRLLRRYPNAAQTPVPADFVCANQANFYPPLTAVSPFTVAMFYGAVNALDELESAGRTARDDAAWTVDPLGQAIAGPALPQLLYGLQGVAGPALPTLLERYPDLLPPALRRDAADKARERMGFDEVEALAACGLLDDDPIATARAALRHSQPVVLERMLERLPEGSAAHLHPFHELFGYARGFGGESPTAQCFDLLWAAGVDREQPDAEGRTPLMAAVVSGAVRPTKQFIDAGVDLDAVDLAGATALDHARHPDRRDCQALLEAALARDAVDRVLATAARDAMDDWQATGGLHA